MEVRVRRSSVCPRSSNPDLALSIVRTPSAILGAQQAVHTKDEHAREA